MSTPSLYVIITGGIGSGKTHIIRALAQEFQWPMVNVDDLVTKCYSEASAQLLAIFGTDVKAEISDLIFSGKQSNAMKAHQVNRLYDAAGHQPGRPANALVAEICEPFMPAKAKATVEKIFEPLVQAALDRATADHPRLLVEFPLWFEKNGASLFNGKNCFVISVLADAEVRIDRAIKRAQPGDSAGVQTLREKIRNVITSQVSDRTRATQSDLIIYSDRGEKGSDYERKEIQRVADAVHDRLKELELRPVASRQVPVNNPPRRVGVVAGSFDPITNGHLWIVKKALDLVDQVVILVAINPSKKHLLSLEARGGLVVGACAEKFTKEEVARIRVDRLPEGEALATYALENYSAKFIFRGVRNFTDFEFENQLALVQRKLTDQVETVYLIPPRELTEVSSSMVKSMLGIKGWEKIAKDYVPQCVLKVLSEAPKPVKKPAPKFKTGAGSSTQRKR